MKFDDYTQMMIERSGYYTHWLEHTPPLDWGIECDDVEQVRHPNHAWNAGHGDEGPADIMCICICILSFIF